MLPYGTRKVTPTLRRRGGFHIRPQGARNCRGVGDAAPYTQPYVGCRGEQCSPVESCAIVQLHGRTKRPYILTP